MTKAEWTLWITSTLFQAVIAWQVIWDAWQSTKHRKAQAEYVRLARTQRNAQAEVVQ